MLVIAPGVYNLTATLTLPANATHGVSLEGAGAVVQYVGNDTATIQIGGDDVLVDGLTFRNLLVHVEGAADGAVIRNARFEESRLRFTAGAGVTQTVRRAHLVAHHDTGRATRLRDALSFITARRRSLSSGAFPARVPP